MLHLRLALVGTCRHQGMGISDHGGTLGETRGALIILNPQLVAGKHGFFGNHESEDIQTIFICALW